MVMVDSKAKQNNKGEGCICLHLFTTGNITRHCLAVKTALVIITVKVKNLSITCKKRK
jgi:hypothetical protein